MEANEFIKQYQRNRKQTQSLKWDALEERFQDAELLPLWVADMEFAIPTEVKNALLERVEQGVFGYSQNNPDYFAEFAAWQAKRHHIYLKKDWLRFSTGVVQSLYHLINCFTEKGDGVIIQPPVYYPFFQAIKDTKRRLITAPLKETNLHYEMDLADFETQLRNEKPKLFILCSPHNPVGRIWKAQELEKILELCHQYHVLVIADEIHQDFEIGDHHFVSTLNVANGEYRDELIVVNSPSKTFNLASLLHSHILIPNEQIRKVYDEEIQCYQQTENNLLGQLAGKMAYQTGEDWFVGLLQVINNNYQYLKKRLQAFPDIRFSPLEGSYLVWIDLRRCVPKEKIREYVQNKARLAVDYGEWFSETNKGFIRLNLATTPEILQQALDQLLLAVQIVES